MAGRKRAKRAVNHGRNEVQARGEEQQQPRTVVIIRVSDSTGAHEYISNADADELTDEQTDAHRFVIDDARKIQHGLRNQHHDVSLIGIGDEKSVNVEQHATHRVESEA